MSKQTETKTDKTVSSAKRASMALRELIFSGALPAGSDHLESELAEQLGMSRTPVREAVVLLESRGLVEVRPRRGVRIRPVSAADMREIYDVLTVLECMSAEQAARRGPCNAGLEALGIAINDMEQAIEADDRKAWAAADDRFHDELVRLGGNQRVVKIVEWMSDQVRRARATTLYLRPMPVKSNEDHRAVFEAIRAGDPERAGQVHRQHREQARDVLVDLLERLGLQKL